jgi:pyruvate, orthophosphate dikinase
MPKERIIELLGEGELLLPDLVRRALDANDRVKFLLTLLQSARVAADHGGDMPDLREERLASGVEDAALDRVVGKSSRRADGVYMIPGAEQLARRALAEVARMIAPLRVAETRGAEALASRLDQLSGAVAPEGDTISDSDISALTAGPGGEDSLHLLVVDVHRQLNRLQQRVASDSIEGARVHDLADEDRPLVAAFMHGLQRTQGLRFGHPGLDTLATRSGDALVLQNDIGQTDAHVLVVRVVGRDATITYTDVHLERLLFFQRLFAGRDVTWGDTRSRNDREMEGGLYHLATGRFGAESANEVEEFLAFLGSRLVFLIDWNKARKRLRDLVGKQAALGLLDWAAEHDHGHMAFLLAGGEQLVFDALDFAAGRSTRAGDSLTAVLGAENARTYLRAVLQISSEGMLARRPLSLIQDEVRAELIGYLRTARQELLGLITEHAELVVELAETARDALEQAALPRPTGRRQVVAAQAGDLERQADEAVNQVRAASGRAEDPKPFLELIEAADDVADSLEESSYYLGLLRQGRPAGSVRARVRQLATVVLDASRAYLRAAQLGREVQRGGPSEDMDAFLEAVHRTVALERETDEIQRSAHAALVAEVEAAGELFTLVETTRAFEEAADSLMHVARMLREQVLGGVVRSEPASGRIPAGAAAEPAPGAALDGVDEAIYVLGEGDDEIPDRDEIGAKAHGLARMVRAGLRVPEATVLGTAVSRSQLAGRDAPQLHELLPAAVRPLESRTGLRLGSSRRPLLLSVRSGSPVSMPGMLETVLDVGLCDATVGGLMAMTGNPRLAWDCYRRLVESFGHVVAGCPPQPFEQATREWLSDSGVARPRDLDASSLAHLTRSQLERFQALTGTPFPQDPTEQLEAAVAAVLGSWQAPKAREYRRLNEVPDSIGTAVILQRMVFGNAGGLSGSGVAFTRNPTTGEPGLYMDFLLDAQGEDVVSGRQAVDGAEELTLLAPELEERIAAVCPRLEAEFADAQEFELTVQDGELFLLQTRTAKRTPWAALRIAVDQVREGLIDQAAARERIAPLDLDAIRRVRVRSEAKDQALCRALPASMGVASGPVALDVEAARRLAGEGHPPILVRPDTTTEDIAGMALAAGVLTGSGGRTSHAAVVARDRAKPCLVGCHELEVDLDARRARIGQRTFAEGDEICLDAESGLVFAGRPRVVEERPSAELATVASWARGAQPPGLRSPQATSQEHGQ